jgi:predicted transcriptional regulator
MSRFKSISPLSKLSPDQLGEIFELIANKRMTVDEAALNFNVAKTTISRQLDTHYYGIVPKHRQKTITLQSKINNDKYETLDHHRTGAIAM